jgi:hypothetical protein
MATKFISPGVFTQEIDQSYLAQGVANIGAGLIGVTLKGPAFRPTPVSDFNSFVATFSGTDPTLQAPYAAQNYLKNSTTLQMVRVLGDRNGTNISNGWDHSIVAITGAASGGLTPVLAELVILSGTALSLSSSATMAVAVVSGVLFTSVLVGFNGNAITVQYISGVAATASVAGDAITVTVQPGISDEGDVVAAVNGNGSAFALVSASYAASGTTVSSSVAVSLSGGSYITFFQFSGSGVDFTGTFPKNGSGSFSFLTGAANYMGLVLNDDPTKADQYGHYLWKNFEWGQTGSFAPIGTASLAGVSATSSFDHDFVTPSTPWVLSQSGSQLFQFMTIADGQAANTDVKVSVTNIKASPYPNVTAFGTFDVIVRVFGDTDLRPQVLETWANMTLDPSASNYLLRAIGNKSSYWNSATSKNVYTGQFANQSKYIIVVTGTENTSPGELPWAHAGYTDNYSSAGGTASLLDVPLVISGTDNQGNPAAYIYWGIDLSQQNVTDRLKGFAYASTGSGAPQAEGAAVSLAHVSGTSSALGTSYNVYNTAYSGNVPSLTSQQGFTLAFQGGFDGWDVTNPVPVPTGSLMFDPIAQVSLRLAVDTLSNPDEISINLLALPGVTDPAVTSYAETMCNNRADVMYIMDIDGASVDAAVSTINTRGVDDNYTATYYPDLWLADNVNNIQVQVKPSVAVLGAYAYSDRVGQVFFAPAGLNRGGLAAFGIVDVLDRLTFQDRNDLYEARINPIATFPSEGIVVFGQKTLQAQPSALDRVNVRRLLIFAKVTIASAAKYLLFEPNNAATWQRFLNTVNPILQTIQQNQGLERFKVVMDTTVNTPDLIDRNIMTGKIFLQPTKAAEFIDLSFVITASGVAFDE